MRRKTDAKRDAIVQASYAVFIEYGFSGTSMTEIAARAGSSKSTLYAYYKSKEDLFIDVVESAGRQHMQPIMEALAYETDDLTRALQRFGEQSLAVICSHAFIQARRAIIAESGRSDIGRRFYDIGPFKGIQAIAAFLEGQMHAGRLRHADPLLAARHLTALLDCETVEPRLLGLTPDLPAQQLRQAAERAIETFLRGYAPVEPTTGA